MQGGELIGSCTRTSLADVTLHNDRSRRTLSMRRRPLLPTRSYAVPLQVSSLYWGVPEYRQAGVPSHQTRPFPVSWDEEAVANRVTTFDLAAS